MQNVIWKPVIQVSPPLDEGIYAYQCRTCGQTITTGDPEPPMILCPNCMRRRHEQERKEKEALK